MKKKPKKSRKKKKQNKKQQPKISTGLAVAKTTTKKLPKEIPKKKQPKPPEKIPDFQPATLESPEDKTDSKDLLGILLEEEATELISPVIFQREETISETPSFENPYSPNAPKEFYSQTKDKNFYSPREQQEGSSERADYLIHLRMRTFEEQKTQKFYDGVFYDKSLQHEKNPDERHYTAFVSGIVEFETETDLMDESISAAKKFYDFGDAES